MEETRCPVCDGPMTPRTSAHGKFWGCKAFPKCRGTRNSMGMAQNRFESETDNRSDEDELPSQRWAGRDKRRW